MTSKGDFCQKCGKDAHNEDGVWMQNHFADCELHPTRRALANMQDINNNKPEKSTSVDLDLNDKDAVRAAFGIKTRAPRPVYNKLAGVSLTISLDTLKEIVEGYYETDVESVRYCKKNIIVEFKKND